jgi:hypothetical protein
MNHGQYHPEPQMHGLPMNYEDVQGLEYSMQSPHLATTFVRLPRPASGQDFIASSSSTQIYPPNNAFDHFVNPMEMVQTANSWEASFPVSASLDHPYTNGLYRYTPLLPEPTHDGSFLSIGQYHTSYETPRSLSSPGESELFSRNHVVRDGYGNSFYSFPQVKPEFIATFPDQLELPCNTLDNLRDLRVLSLNRSSKIDNEEHRASPPTQPPPFSVPSCNVSEDGHTSREMTTIDNEEQPTDEPYAKLIYRALISTPNHAMVLQEIYQWFRENTGKGSSDTKGWMNSIRHNLSMNAVSYTQSHPITSLIPYRLSRRQSGSLLQMTQRSLRSGYSRILQ